MSGDGFMPWPAFTKHMAKTLTGSLVTKWPSLTSGGLDLNADTEIARYAKWCADRYARKEPWR